MSETNEELKPLDEQSPSEPAVGKQKKPVGKEIMSWVLTLGCAVVLALLIRTFIFEPIRVDGDSMKNTLINGQIVYCSKIDYIVGAPQRFDVVIVHYPDRENKRFVKRLVGLPGDSVKVENGKLSVLAAGESDWVEYDEPYIGSVPQYTLDPVLLEEGQYFVLGDNRGNSNDSHLIGPLTRDQLLGHVRFVIYPFDQIHGIQ